MAMPPKRLFMPNISRAFPASGAVEDGAVVILGTGGRVVGRIRIEECASLETITWLCVRINEIGGSPWLSRVDERFCG